MDYYKSLDEQNCTEASIHEFPPDLFTQEQRQSGYVALHFVGSFYLFYFLAVVCDEYFVPSVERIAKEFKIPSEIAGATILGIANSSPELFTNIIGTFVTKGDLGLANILGASVFNIFAVGACIGLATPKDVHVQWWPISRDCIFYVISVVYLFQILMDHEVRWWDGMTLILLYFVYIFFLYFNSTIRSWVKRIIFYRNTGRSYSIKKNSDGDDKGVTRSPTTSTNTLTLSIDPSESSFNEDDLERIPEIVDIEDEDESLPLFKVPHGEKWTVWAQWIVGWPIRLILKFTVPDCKKAAWRHWYPVTFFMCIAWNTALCYLVSYFVTVIGYTFEIPDSVMGLTAIAIGTSVPQAVSSIIVARKGLGTMAMNNAIGSNIFNVLICLGVPWLIQILVTLKTEEPYIQIYSQALEYTTLMLILSIAILYILIVVNKFTIDKKIGCIALVLYIAFLTIGSLFELNVFFYVNQPTCKS